MSQYIAIWNPRPGHRCWFWRGYHHYRHEGQQASHGRCWWAGSSRTRRELSLLCSSREGPRPLLLWNKGRFSRRKVSIFSDPWYSLTFRRISCVCTKPRHKFLMKSFIHGCDSISSTYLQKVSDPEYWSVTYSLAVSDVYSHSGSVIISNDISLRSHPSAQALWTL